MSLRRKTNLGKSNDPRAAVVDEYGELERKIALLAPTIARRDALREKILSWCAGQPADEAVTVQGAQYRIDITPCEYKRFIPNMAAVFRLFGQDKFLQYCTFPLGILDSQLSKAEQRAVIRKERLGSRRISAVAKAAPARAA